MADLDAALATLLAHGATLHRGPAVTDFGARVALLIDPFGNTLSGRMKTIHTLRCTIEPQLEAHAPAMFDVLSDPAIYEFEGEPPPTIERLAAGYRRRESRLSPDGREQWLNWVVRLPNAELVGYVQATVLESGVSYVAYEFGSRHWRQGIGSASVTAMLNELAQAYGVHTYVAVLKSANFRSMGLLHHLGFVPGNPVDAEKYEAEQDEVVMVKASPNSPFGLPGAANAATPVSSNV